jgi:hypothetical protein
MKKLLSLALLFAAQLVAVAAPVGVCINNVAQTISNGLIAPIPFATITLCTPGSTISNCSAHIVQTYADTTLTTFSPTTALTPYTSDVGGNYYFCAPVGHYGLLIGSSYGSYFVPDVTLADNWAAGGVVTGTWQATSFVGPLTGNSSTATAEQTLGAACNPSTQYAYGLDIHWNALCFNLPTPATLYYQTDETNGTPMPQESVNNFSTNFVLSDSPSPSRTNVDLAANISSNAATASALAASPSNCSANNATTGIAANGTAQGCFAPLLASKTIVMVNTSVCTPTTSTDANCTGSITLSGGGYADSAYAALLQVTSSAAASIGIVVTSKTATTISYSVYCTFNCGSYGTVQADVFTYHP